MMSSKRVSGAALAAAAAMLFGTVTTAVAEEAKIHCDGVNSCKGTSACGTASNSCAGKNSCKGMGFLEMTPAECAAAKEKVEQEKAKEKGKG